MSGEEPCVSVVVARKDPGGWVDDDHARDRLLPRVGAPEVAVQQVAVPAPDRGRIDKDAFDFAGSIDHRRHHARTEIGGLAVTGRSSIGKWSRAAIRPARAVAAQTGP